MPVQRSTDNETGIPFEEFVADFEYWSYQERFPGSAVCMSCEQPFATENPCWNSYASYKDGTHNDGTCRQCSERRGF